MNLRSFHIFLISISIALSALLAFWGMDNSPILGALGGIAGVALAIYLIWFVRGSHGAHLLPCAVCFGPLESQAGRAMENAIWFLIAVTALVLIGVSYLVFRAIRSSGTHA